MRACSRSILVIFIAVLALAVAVPAADQNPNIGTWKMIPAKSKSSSAPMKSYIIKIEVQGDGVKVVQDMIQADGKALHRSWTAKYDGKEYPVTAPDADTMSFTRPDAPTTEYVFKKNGKEVWRGRAVVSKDGKSSIDTGGGTDANGQPFTYSIFAEKQ